MGGGGGGLHPPPALPTLGEAEWNVAGARMFGPD